MKEILDSISYHYDLTEMPIHFRLWPWSRKNRGANSSIRFAKLLNQQVFTSAFPLHEVKIIKLCTKYFII